MYRKLAETRVGVFRGWEGKDDARRYSEERSSKDDGVEEIREEEKKREKRQRLAGDTGTSIIHVVCLSSSFPLSLSSMISELITL